MKKQLFITLLAVLVLLVSVPIAHAERKVIRSQLDESLEKFYELRANGAEGEFRFNLSNNEEYIAIPDYQNGVLKGYQIGPVNPKPKPVSSNVEVNNDFNIPPANTADINSIPKEELKAAIAKANELWQAMENKEAEVFRTSYSEKDWKMVPVKTESGMVYVLLRQGIEGEITRGPRAVPEDEPIVQTVPISQDTKKEPDTPAQPEVKLVEPPKTDAKQTGEVVPTPSVKEPKKPTPDAPVAVAVKKTEEKKTPNAFVKLLKWLFRR